MEKSNKKVIIVYILIIIYICTSYIPLHLDDFNFSNIVWTAQRVRGLNDILYSQKQLYLLWTERVIVHALIQIFLFLVKNIFDILNGIVFIILINNILKLAKLKLSCTHILLCFFLLWRYIPHYGETVLWITGSLNYLWSTTMLLFYISNLMEEKRKQSNFLILFIATIAGATNFYFSKFYGFKKVVGAKRDNDILKIRTTGIDGNNIQFFYNTGNSYNQIESSYTENYGTIDYFDKIVSYFKEDKEIQILLKEQIENKNNYYFEIPRNNLFGIRIDLGSEDENKEIIIESIEVLKRTEAKKIDLEKVYDDIKKRKVLINGVKNIELTDEKKLKIKIYGNDPYFEIIF